MNDSKIELVPVPHESNDSTVVEQKTYYFTDGNYVYTTNHDSVVEHLEPQIYIVGFTPFSNTFFLEKNAASHFELPEKIYGNTVFRHSDRIIETFKDRDSNTGVLLSGEKGSGKTLLSKLLANRCLQMGMPVLIINSQYSGDTFNKFISSIKEKCLIIFDEFEKTYDDENQAALLSLLDGLYNKKNLLVFTCNRLYDVNYYLFNRPGRIYYHIKYQGLDEDFIRSYCSEKLHDTEKTEQLVKVALTNLNFNFDMLKALCEELNRYPSDDLPAVLSYLNVDIEDGDQEIHCAMTVTDEETGNIVYADDSMWYSPLSETTKVYISGKHRKRETKGQTDPALNSLRDSVDLEQADELIIVKPALLTDVNVPVGLFVYDSVISESGRLYRIIIRRTRGNSDDKFTFKNLMMRK